MAQTYVGMIGVAFFWHNALAANIMRNTRGVGETCQIPSQRNAVDGSCRYTLLAFIHQPDDAVHCEAQGLVPSGYRRGSSGEKLLWSFADENMLRGRVTDE
jgi:hypothetical protein